jgi:hypothetical protein
VAGILEKSSGWALCSAKYNRQDAMMIKKSTIDKA